MTTCTIKKENSILFFLGGTNSDISFFWIFKTCGNFEGIFTVVGIEQF